MKTERIEFDAARYLPTSEEVGKVFSKLQLKIGTLLKELNGAPFDVVFKFSHETKFSSASEKRIRNIQAGCQSTSAKVYGEFHLQTEQFQYVSETLWENIRNWVTSKIKRTRIPLSRKTVQEMRLQQLLSLVSYCVDEGVVIIDVFDQTKYMEQYAIIDSYANNWKIIYPSEYPLPQHMIKINSRSMTFSSEFRKNFNRMKVS